MTTLSKKIDFAVIFKVTNANPNGDPLNENMPRMISGGFGEVSDVCLKRKIRNRLLDEKENILIQSDNYRNDSFNSIRERLEEGIGKFIPKTKSKGKKKEEVDESEDAPLNDKLEYVKKACEKWIDVRSFGQVLALEAGKGEKSGTSIGIRGPVTIQSAFSIEPIYTPDNSIQIAKSTNNETSEKKGSDTLGMKHRVMKGIYVFKGAMNPQLATKTGFSDEDANKIKQVLPKLFENDSSSARPEGSMEVLKVIWWEHDSQLGKYPSAKVHRSLEGNIDANTEELLNEKELMEGTVEEIKGLKADIQNGW